MTQPVPPKSLAASLAFAVVLLGLTCPAPWAYAAALRVPLDPGKANALGFPPVEAKFVRLVIQRTHGGQPCIDELEIYGPGSTENLALASRGSRASASSCLEGHAAHQIAHLNDGQYGNAHSWIAATATGWAQIELPRPAMIDRVVISRDREGRYRDRLPAALEIQVSSDGAQWRTVQSIESPATESTLGRALLPIDRPAHGELPQDWASRIMTHLSGSLRKEGETRRKQVRTLDDARAMLELVDLEQQRHLLTRRLTLEFNVPALRRAVQDLTSTYPGRYQTPAGLDARLEAGERRTAELKGILDRGTPDEIVRAMAEAEQWIALPRSVLLANPLLDFAEILVLKRKTAPEQGSTYWQWGLKYGMTVNWSCDFRPKNQPIAPWWDDEFAALALHGEKAPLRTIFKPPATHMLQHPELHFDATKMLFSMPGPNGAFQVFEMRLDGSDLRQITCDTADDVDNGDPCYLPDGRIIFNSTRLFGGVPCEDGNSYISGLCLTDAEGRHTRMLTFDQESNWYPSLLHDGRVLYTRYEYANTSHQFGRHLFHMNPDGSSQMEYYGSNSYWPNSIFYARAVPGHPTMVVGVVCGHHGPNRTGRLVLFDPARGRHETSGAVQTIPGYGKPVERIATDMLYAGDWPKFVHPWPLSEKYFLAAARLGPEQAEYAIYLVDVFDNVTEICRLTNYSLLEPIPIKKQPVPPVIPDRVDPRAREGLVYLADVYQGPGLQGVPRGSVKQLRLFTYNYVYRNTSARGFGHLATPGVDGPWEPRFLLGTVPVRDDGSALFHVPANTPISVQPVDAQGRALQQMRSWFTAMPGERVSCIGCHEQHNGSPPVAVGGSVGRPDRITPWRGPARGFDFEREVQPVLDRYCVGCHDGGHPERPDLTRKSDAEKRLVSQQYRERMETSISTIFTPAFLALQPYVRRPHAESNQSAKVPGDYFADTSLLVQMLLKGHHNVTLDEEAWQRLYAWIDLGAPDHGSWHNSVWGSPANFHQRRLEMLAQFADRTDDVEWMPAPAKEIPRFTPPAEESPAPPAPVCPHWPFDPSEARRRQQAVGLPVTLKLEIAKGLTIDFVLVPAGEFVIGDPQGAPDERRTARAQIGRPFYLSRCEITNAQFAALVDPSHDSGYADWLSIDWRGEGYPLSAPEQPVVRVSWQEARRFCRVLSAKLGRRFDLPTEAQWEWACRAGTDTPLWYGSFDDDFSKRENLAGREQRKLAFSGKPKWFLRDDRFDDAVLVSAPVGSFQPNPWGLHDMAGNVAEWTRSRYRADPDGSSADDANDEPQIERVVRGGSWRSRPQEATSAHRWKYPAWRKVYDVGFRVALEALPGKGSSSPVAQLPVAPNHR